MTVELTRGHIVGEARVGADARARLLATMPVTERRLELAGVATSVLEGGDGPPLVLVDTFGLSPFQPAPEFGRALTDFLTDPNEESHDGLWRYCAFDLDRLRERMGESWHRYKAYNLDRARAPALHDTQQSLMEQFGIPAIPPAELERIAVPTTLIWGRHDLATPLSVAEAASERYGWPLRVIDDAADDPPIEQPEAFLKALDSTLGHT